MNLDIIYYETEKTGEKCVSFMNGSPGTISVLGLKYTLIPHPSSGISNHNPTTGKTGLLVYNFPHGRLCP